MHDTDKRVKAAGKTDLAAYRAWAWGGTAPANISINVSGLGGYHNGTRIGLVTRRDVAGATFSLDTVRRFLIHEVQHDADHHESSHEGAGERGGFDDDTWRAFKTEYRSYWLDGRYDSLSPSTQHTDTHPDINGGAVIAGKNARSFACIKHLWISGTAYQHIIGAYNGSTRFRDLVHRHNGVDSANATNDPRVDDFVRSIAAHQATSAHDAWVAMTPEQRTTVRNNGEIRRLIQSGWPITDCYRVPLLGLVDFNFSDQDFRQASRFCFALWHGNEHDLRAEARTMGRAREFLLGSADFRSYAAHYTAFGNNAVGFTMSWNADDVIALLNGSRPRGDFPHSPELTGCFAAGTPVLLGDRSSCPIERIEVGQEVLAYDEHARRNVARRVLQRHEHAPEPTFRAYVAGLAEPLIVTAHHRFYIASARAWIALGELTAGAELFFHDAVLGESSPRRLIGVEPAGNVPVFNLSVDEHPSYFVHGILVHNTKLA